MTRHDDTFLLSYHHSVIGSFIICVIGPCTLIFSCMSIWQGFYAPYCCRMAPKNLLAALFESDISRSTVCRSTICAISSHTWGSTSFPQKLKFRVKNLIILQHVCRERSASNALKVQIPNICIETSHPSITMYLHLS